MTANADLDGEAVVARIWEIDGPYTAEQLAEAMMALQHLVRYANHATLNASRTVLPDADDVATVARRLGDALGGLPHLLHDLACRCDELAEDPALRSTRRDVTTDPVVAAFTAGIELRDAGVATGSLRARIQRGSSALLGIGLDTGDGQ